MKFFYTFQENRKTVAFMVVLQKSHIYVAMSSFVYLYLHWGEFLPPFSYYMTKRIQLSMFDWEGRKGLAKGHLLFFLINLHSTRVSPRFRRAISNGLRSLGYKTPNETILKVVWNKSV